METLLQLKTQPELQNLVTNAVALHAIQLSKVGQQTALQELRQKVHILVVTMAPKQALQSQIRSFETVLEELHDWIERQGRKWFVKQLAQSKTIGEMVQFHENKLNGLYTTLKLSIPDWQQDSAYKAHVRDQNALEQYLMELLQNHTDLPELMELLGIIEANLIESTDHLEMVVKHLTQKDADLESISKIKTLILKLQARTGSSSRVECRWNVISEEELCNWSKTPIGAGSFGEVYKARWHTTVVAVKRSHEKIRGKQIIDTIREEIDRWSKIHHPNVAEMIGACINTDKPFIVMRYYKNGNLAEYVLSHPELTILERHKWMYDIAAGLDAIHKVGMIHGDLKGDNILLDDLNTAVITDFGLSQLKKTGSSSSSAITNKKMTEAIRWIAPERYGRRFRLAPSYDIFAFGMTCYQILTGRVPFDEESNDQIVKEWIREGEVPDRPTNVPDYVWDLFERCIAKELSERVGMPEILSIMEANHQTLTDSPPELMQISIPSPEKREPQLDSAYDSVSRSLPGVASQPYQDDQETEEDLEAQRRDEMEELKQKIGAARSKKGGRDEQFEGSFPVKNILDTVQPKKPDAEELPSENAELMEALGQTLMNDANQGFDEPEQSPKKSLFKIQPKSKNSKPKAKMPEPKSKKPQPKMDMTDKKSMASKHEADLDELLNEFASDDERMQQTKESDSFDISSLSDASPEPLRPEAKKAQDDVEMLNRIIQEVDKQAMASEGFQSTVQMKGKAGKRNDHDEGQDITKTRQDFASPEMRPKSVQKKKVVEPSYSKNRSIQEPFRPFTHEQSDTKTAKIAKPKEEPRVSVSKAPAKGSKDQGLGLLEAAYNAIQSTLTGTRTPANEPRRPPPPAPTVKSKAPTRSSVSKISKPEPVVEKAFVVMDQDNTESTEAPPKQVTKQDQSYPPSHEITETDAQKQYEIGIQYLQDKNEKMAARYIGLAAETLAIAQVQLGLMFKEGMGVQQDDEKAIQLFELAAVSGDAEGYFQLGWMMEDARGTEQNPQDAARCYRMAAEQGHKEAQYRYGVMLETGNGVTKSETEAALWYTKASEQGYADAQTNLGYLYRNGKGVPTDNEKAAELYRLAAIQGNARAQCNLGYLYETGQGVPLNDEEAVKYYLLAAEQGLPRAQSYLSWMYENGRGVPKNDKKAFEWCRKAAEQDYYPAQCSLALMYKDGRGTQQNPSKWVHWMQRSAKGGYPEAQHKLGHMLADGEGLPKNEMEAAKLYQKASDQNYAPAINSLGYLYERGKGVPKNDKQAALLYKRAAEQNLPLAQYNLADMYQWGKGVDKNESLAITLFRKAASQGLELAIARLKEMGHPVQ